MAQADQDQLGLSGRVRDLAPVNFDGTDIATTEQRRRRFTSTSWDLKSLGLTEYTGTAPTAARTWEYSGGQFPSTTLTSQRPLPFRCPDPNAAQADDLSPVLQLLKTSSSSLNNSLRKLSINHLCDWEGTAGTSNLIFRPLTPHPDSSSPFGQLGAGAVNSDPTLLVNVNSKPSAIQSAADQEWFARRDRQQLCRDIYTLMYYYCGGEDKNYSGANPYAVDLTGPTGAPDGIPDALADMAQFAVNLVDRMDPDYINTKFEFDINLADGWELDDDPFTKSTTSPTPGYMGVEATDARIGTVGGERGVVYGVEDQQLTLNEAQVVLARQVKDASGTAPTNHNGTEWDDTQNRDWTYVELENVSPTSIDFANESWQIVVKPGNAIQDPSNPNQTLLIVAGDTSSGIDPTQIVFGEERRLTLTAPAANTFFIQSGSNSRLMLGTSGDKSNVDTSGSPRPSHVMVNYNDRDPGGDPLTFARITPQIPFDNPGTANIRDLLTAPTTLYRVNKGSMNSGDGGAVTPDPATDLLAIQYPTDTATGMPKFDIINDSMDRVPRGTGIPVKFELRRRLNPLRTPPVAQNPAGSDPLHDVQSEDNPWIVVDTLKVDMDILQLNTTNDDYDEIQKQLTGVDSSTMTPQDSYSFTSKERTQPLVRGEHNHFVNTGGGNDYQRSTLGAINRDTSNNVPSVYSQYQPHFNRDYSSVMELMAVPLYGPEDTTLFLNDSDVYTPPTALAPQVPIAAHKFRHPQPWDTAQPETGNRWYRLFEFLEVPDRSHRHPEVNAAGNPVRPSYIINLGNPSTNPDLFYRRPGRLQLNTLRHPEVLGGLLDDPEVAYPDPGTYLIDQVNGIGSGNNRDWWVQYLQARDGIDPLTNSLILPGLPSSKPFRPFSYTAEGANSLQSTLLRDLPMDVTAGANPKRSLFELGDQSGGPTINHTIKHRMLEKVINNSTTRSNVFLIFIQVDFFEAKEVTDTASGEQVVRVGAKLSDSPAYRGFFVVDRSKARSLLTAGDFPLPTGDPNLYVDPVDNQPKKNFSFNQDFDFHQLILHRQTIN
jgi:hypothetical protein